MSKGEIKLESDLKRKYCKKDIVKKKERNESHSPLTKYFYLSYPRFQGHDAGFGPVVGIDFSTDSKYIRTFSGNPYSFEANCRVEVHIFNLQVINILFLFSYFFSF